MAEEKSFEYFVNLIFGAIVDFLSPILFYPIPLIKMPFIVFVLFASGIFFSLKLFFPNIRFLKHSFDIVAGKYDSSEDKGEISSFQALASALSATVGLGNIAGVAVAIQLGGPGAVFWMWVSAFVGMNIKFSECTFSQLYRDIGSDGSVLGGPFVYLKKGLTERFNKPRLASFVGIFTACCLLLEAFLAGNMFQANQAYELISKEFPLLDGMPLVVGVTMAFLAGIVLIGGIKRIGDVTEKLVPFMCSFYVLSCATIVLMNYTKIPSMFADIFIQAFNPDAIFAGGFIGVMITGIKRACFSNEAGLGTSAIAHSAAKTAHPIREGMVAMLEPLIDTHIVCTFTALAVLSTGAHLDTSLAGKGAQITALAFSSIAPWMTMLLTIATFLFSYSTVLSYSYYGEKATEFIFGKRGIIFFRTTYVFAIILGPVISLTKLIEFADLALLSLAFPNVIGMMLMSGKLKSLLQDYTQKYMNK